jgi:hypothetical protein
MQTKYQIYLRNEDGRLSLEGHWGSENAIFDQEADAQEHAQWLHSQYPENEFIVREAQ